MSFNLIQVMKIILDIVIKFSRDLIIIYLLKSIINEKWRILLNHLSALLLLWYSISLG